VTATSRSAERTLADADRGRHAESPRKIPARGWKDVLVRSKVEAKEDHVTLFGAGVALFGFLALVPALAAMLSIYGLVADPATIDNQLADSLSAAPAEVRDLISQQVRAIGDASSGAIVTVVVGFLLALWSASAGIKSLIEAINLAYDEDESRGFVKLRGLALLFTLGAILFLVVAFAVIAFLPPLIGSTGLGTAGRVLISVLRFVVLFAGVLFAFAVLYRYAPDRDEPKWAWVTPGAVFAGVMWIVASLLFSFYTANFGKYNETYGALAAIVVVILWLWISATVVIFGAEINCELERQTVRDTTKGAERPLGQRNAYAADTIGTASETG
jgi:membrane protein